MNQPARFRSTRPLAVILACGLVLSLPACRLPKLCCAQKGEPLPDSFNGEVSLDSSAQLGWREFFDDPTLSGLIDQALVGNQELKILAQDIRIANFEIMARQGEYLPFVNLGARAGLEKSSVYSREGAVEENLLANGKAFPDPLPEFLVAANVSWEIDIWRKLRNAKDAAALRYFATRDGQNYVVTRLVAEVAENYYELLALDNRMMALDKTIEIQQQSLDFSIAKKEAARETELAVQRFEAEVRKNQSEKLIVQQQITEAENRINFLLGRYPQPVPRQSASYIDLQLHALSTGLPSQLLQNRADIRQAERELAARGLDVRVARARFYPSLSLTAGVGYQAFNTKYLFISPESLIYNAAGELVGPLINRKAIKADYLSANAAQIQAVYDYQLTVLDAYTEVINLMNKVENYSQSIAIKKQQLAALESSVDNATKLFQNARAEYMEVLLAQRDLIEARMVLIETKQEQLSAVVNAYQALGGGAYGGYSFLADATNPMGGTELIAPPENFPAANEPLTQPDSTTPQSQPLPTSDGDAPATDLLPYPDAIRDGLDAAPTPSSDATPQETGSLLKPDGPALNSQGNFLKWPWQS
ncbi:Cation efflux system protein CusC precursor [Planctomycetes bacterium K2D]|uniref:Cation efflux system protein CusC n=1 Tax=Botrimarina mediterranea TaxID=2528022 RepID=A0A518K9P1_9BACT|nr:Cation efflux system protein CusC precursor [Botrimarina mediterranea]QDV79148.1 Cation efflux system protein CusC precursor [Planctomycetes bacterium K2D]